MRIEAPRPEKCSAGHRTTVESPPLVFLGVFFLLLGSPVLLATDFSDQEIEFFERRVRPVLSEHCYGCHGSDGKKLKAGLRVDSRSALLSGGDSGEAIIPGDVDGSLLIEAVRYEGYEMPPSGKLPDEQIHDLEKWVQMGAPWPDEDAPVAGTMVEEFDLQKRRNEHWVWQPIRQPTVPDVDDPNWPNNAIDHFILSRLQQGQLQPAEATDRAALLRRLHLDLTGLPPTIAEIDSFLQDSAPDATERVLDRLLDSPHFGERWGRHWLDLVRYAESRGHEFDNDARNAFQYRDYIIRAFNADVPYDQLVREHIAGDLLDSPRLNPDHGFNESVLGTGFWFLGEWVHSPVDIRKDESDRFDNMIDVMSKTFLGVTVSCARCHDHKFDAISTADYYAISGFLQSSDYRQVRFESVENNRGIEHSRIALDGRYQNVITELVSGYESDLLPIEPLSPELQQVIAVDFAEVSKDEFLQNGFIFGDRPRRRGEAYLTLGGKEPAIAFRTQDAAINDPLWDGLVSINEKGVHNKSRLTSLPRSGRTLRTPTFTLTDGNVHCRVAGEGSIVACVDSHRLIAGPLHGETIRPIAKGNSWTKLNLARYVGHRIHLEFTPAAGKQIEVSLVTMGATKSQLDALAAREESIKRGAESFSEGVLSQLGEPLRSIAQRWTSEREELKSGIMLRSQTAMAMMDGTGEDDHVLIRGNSSKPGKVEPRHFLTAISSDAPMQIASGSGRLELAQQINANDNPLAARVVVNRAWHYLMGRGIVPTTDDFGVLGAAPTHPELLDHLATWFVSDGQSIKRLIRYIVSSKTYQMSSHTNPDAVLQDPKNLLWHHRPPKRLEGEAIRDSLLALSGRLDPTLFGEPVPIHLTSFMQGRGRPAKSGPADGNGRRSIYTSVRRNFLSPFMLTFDTPVPFSTMGRRNVSNVPAQALILMNDPFVIEQAKGWSKRAREQQLTDEQRIEWMYLSAFARKPTEQEKSIAQRFVGGGDKGEVVAEGRDAAEVWADFAHALINTKEFIFLR